MGKPIYALYKGGQVLIDVSGMELPPREQDLDFTVRIKNVDDDAPDFKPIVLFSELVFVSDEQKEEALCALRDSNPVL